MSLSFDAAWVEANPDFAKTISEWMMEVQNEYNDVYFVTNTQGRAGACGRHFEFISLQLQGLKFKISQGDTIPQWMKIIKMDE